MASSSSGGSAKEQTDFPPTYWCDQPGPLLDFTDCQPRILSVPQEVACTLLEASPTASGGEQSTDQEGADSHTGSAVEEEEPSDTEGEGSHTEGTSQLTTSGDEDASSGDDSLGVECVAITGPTQSVSVPTPPPISTLPSAPKSKVRGATRVSFVPGTAAPASVPPAALSVESVDLLKQIHVGQTSMLHVLHAHTGLLTQLVSFMEGMSSDMSALQRTNQSIASTLTAAVSLLQQSLTPPSPATSTLPTTLPAPSTLTRAHAHTQTHTSTTQAPTPKSKTPCVHTQGTDSRHTGKRAKTLTHTSKSTPHLSPSSTSKTPTLDSPDTLSSKKIFLCDLGLFPTDSPVPARRGRRKPPGTGGSHTPAHTPSPKSKAPTRKSPRSPKSKSTPPSHTSPPQSTSSLSQAHHPKDQTSLPIRVSPTPVQNPQDDQAFPH